MIRIWASLDGSLPRLMASVPDEQKSVKITPVLTWGEAEPVTLELAQRCAEALSIAMKSGGIEGDHHRAWVIDQMVRAIAAGDYGKFIAQHNSGENGPNTYSWDEGIAP